VVEIVEEPTEEIVAEETVEEATEEIAVEETVEEATEEIAVEETAEEATEEIAVEETAEEATEEIVEEIVEEPTEEIVEEIVEEPTEEIVVEIVEEPTEEIVEEETVEEPTEEIAVETVEEPLCFDSYTRHCNENGIRERKPSMDGIELPFFLENQALSSLRLGVEEASHLLVTGNEKVRAAFLNTCIHSLIADYHPEDVEIWLLDYGKNTFKSYLNENTKHIRLISLENEIEFTESFLMFLSRFFARREKMLQYANANAFREYREKCGMYKMPRVVLIAEDAQKMMKAFGENIVLRNLLEHALTEYKKYGLSCIFSADSIDSIACLTEAGRGQFAIKLAMQNDVKEILYTIAVDEDICGEDAIGLMNEMPHDIIWQSVKDNIGSSDNPSAMLFSTV
jgi:hypothetical protein